MLVRINEAVWKREFSKLLLKGPISLIISDSLCKQAAYFTRGENSEKRTGAVESEELNNDGKVLGVFLIRDEGRVSGLSVISVISTPIPFSLFFHSTMTCWPPWRPRTA